ncbi:hypothetical protein HaLaN_16217, partial [Haematococcus lacustris]
MAVSRTAMCGMDMAWACSMHVAHVAAACRKILCCDAFMSFSGGHQKHKRDYSSQALRMREPGIHFVG